MNFKTLSLLSLSLIISCGGSEKSNKKTKSILQEVSQDASFKWSDFPLEGLVEDKERLWSGDHWPMNKSSINYRWQTGEKEFASYQSPTMEELKQMSEAEISLLSPSEKYDILMGNYDYSFFKEVGNKTNIMAQAWEGVGDGWAASTTYHAEPKPITLTNADNIVVSFGSSDIKALLSYYYSNFHNSASQQLGLRCNSIQEEAEGDKNCNDDLTPAQFHWALARVIGKDKRPIIMDIDRYTQVWNHPIVGFNATVINEGDPAEGAPKEAVKTIGIKNKVTYLDRSYNHAWNPVKETWNQVTTGRVYSYQLHLNSKAVVIGSTWISHDRPDFLWIPQKASKFSGKLSGLSKLLAE